MPTSVATVQARPGSNDSDRAVALTDSYSPNNAAQVDDHSSVMEQQDEDIYRGGPSIPARSPSIRSLSSSSSSSSSASSAFGGRLGAISAVVEHAIATWARAWASSSSMTSTTSSSSTSRSIRTAAKSFVTRRRRRRPSLADVHNQQSERQIAARIRAREELRYIPRSFDLYLPNPQAENVLTREGSRTGIQDTRFIHTDSLPLVISHLGYALKDSDRARRVRTRAIFSERRRPSPALQHHHYMMPEEMRQETPVLRKAKKGKGRADASVAAAAMSQTSSTATEQGAAEKAWWLDVSSPTWEDMRAIGKLLHLHPLTLEDILQQDPREKLEIFPKLGYYFIVFRAIESQKTRERFRALHDPRDGRDLSASPMEEGIVGEVNVYLIVFREGICSFHFADIGEHVDHVRKKILKLSQSVNMTSDWIAHGIMDSIVDSFFPFLEGIEKEVADIQDVLVSDKVSQQDPSVNSNSTPPSIETQTQSSPEKILVYDAKEQAEKCSVVHSEKPQTTLKFVERKTRFTLPSSLPLHLRRLKRSVEDFCTHFRIAFKHTPTAKPANLVHRMARTRRLVTSLTRVLAHKSEVVAQLQKRLLMIGEWGLGHGTDHDHDVYVYMGDVQDHILALQQSLAHYERVLSTSQPTYLTHLRVSLSQAQSGTDTAVVKLTTISMGVVLAQTLIGLCSMNVIVPQNGYSGDNFSVFGIVIALGCVIVMVYANFVRLWWKWAKQKAPR